MTSPEPQEHCEKEPMYLVTKKELDMIKNDCAYPTRQFCDCCEYAEGEDPERASGLGCNFIGANALMDIVLTRQQQPRDAVKADAGELTAEDVIAITRAELDDELIREALHIAIHERIGYSEAEHDAAIRAEAKREERKKTAEEIAYVIQREWMCDLAEICYICECVGNGNTDPFESLRRGEQE